MDMSLSTLRTVVLRSLEREVRFDSAAAAVVDVSRPVATVLTRDAIVCLLNSVGLLDGSMDVASSPRDSAASDVGLALFAFRQHQEGLLLSGLSIWMITLFMKVTGADQSSNAAAIEQLGGAFFRPEIINLMVNSVFVVPKRTVHSVFVPKPARLDPATVRDQVSLMQLLFLRLVSVLLRRGASVTDTQVATSPATAHSVAQLEPIQAAVKCLFLRQKPVSGAFAAPMAPMLQASQPASSRALTPVRLRSLLRR